jgi:DNA-binding beta-propeller fold protein YncE
VAEAHVGDTLEAMALEKGRSRIYLRNKAKRQVDVIDREKRALIASWPITKGTVNVAIALDEAYHRLFIACRNGEIVLMDTQTGKEIAALPITKGLDDLKYDAGGKRIYAACNGDADVYEQSDLDNYKLLGGSNCTGRVDGTPGAGSKTVFRGSAVAWNHERRGSGF